ncbi:M56 family metallopeptidase [Nonomuraea soli]|uniref:Zn-dependent protease with chaperone function n=1 Tax=Nonomuraea soli TaxID=1032476 RepID=A0A7W0HQM0_9ACTN|nr:M56 family metallopeptidase [Nonomuraea soli]MBA2892000.1 Zn-dependent protease with chaperone function [Nonomuraea soli]
MIWFVVAALGVLPALFSRRLATAAWPHQHPRAALALWLAVGVSAGVGAISLGLIAAVAPLAAAFPHGMHALTHQLLDGQGLTGLGPLHVAALTWSAGLLAWLLWHTGRVTARTLAERRRQRTLIDLLAVHSADHDAYVLPDDAPVAYCVSGRVVLSRGTIDLLTEQELAAVLAHERAHARGRHDLLRLPFVAIGLAFPRLKPAREAVEALLEMLADDHARRPHGDRVLAGAIVQMISPAASPGMGFADGVVVQRVERLLTGLGKGSRLIPLAAYTASVLLTSGPVAVAVAPILCSARVLDCEGQRTIVVVGCPPPHVQRPVLAQSSATSSR